MGNKGFLEWMQRVQIFALFLALDGSQRSQTFNREN